MDGIAKKKTLEYQIQEELKRFEGNEQKLKEILKFLSVLKA